MRSIFLEFEKIFSTSIFLSKDVTFMKFYILHFSLL